MKISEYIQKMGKEFITFGNIEIEKHKFHYHKKPISIYGVNIDRIVVSNKVPSGKECFIYFIGCKIDYEKVMPLCINLQKMPACRSYFDETKSLFDKR